MGKLPDNFFHILRLISQKLSLEKYALRGTAGLVLQGFDMNVEDIDVVCDEETALKCNRIFKEYLVGEVECKETGKFKSFFGEFLIEGVSVEIMGNWQIMDQKGNWSQVYDGSNSVKVRMDGFEVCVTPVETELSVFAQMGRWNAFHKIKRQLKVKEDESQLKLF